jgi:hypothetical protein
MSHYTFTAMCCMDNLLAFLVWRRWMLLFPWPNHFYPVNIHAPPSLPRPSWLRVLKLKTIEATVQYSDPLLLRLALGLEGGELLL